MGILSIRFRGTQEVHKICSDEVRKDLHEDADDMAKEVAVGNILGQVKREGHAGKSVVQV